jgi:hypothetical protein
MEGLPFIVAAPMLIAGNTQDIKARGQVIIATGDAFEQTKQQRRLNKIALASELEALEEAAKTRALEEAIKRISESLITQFRTHLPAGETIAVVNLRSDDDEMSEFIIDEIEHHLIKTREFRVVDRDKVDKIRFEKREKWRQANDRDARRNLAIEMGKELEASVVITGIINKTESEQRLRVWAINVETSNTIARGMELLLDTSGRQQQQRFNREALEEVLKREALRNAIEGISESLIAQLPAGKTIAIVNLASPSKEWSEIAIEEMELRLVKAQFTIVGREELNEILRRQGQEQEFPEFQVFDRVSPDDVRSIGDAVKASVVITGSIREESWQRIRSSEEADVSKEVGKRLRVRVRALDVETGDIIASARELFK